MPFLASEAISLDSPIVLAALLSFVSSVGAAVLAINLYSLLRTGRVGASWRVLIIASVLFALLQAIKLAELISPSANALHVSSVVEVVFVLALAYAFYLQRQVFEEHRRSENLLTHDDCADEEDEREPVQISAYERY